MAGLAQPPGALPEPLSPELALVDPVLRERALALLPDPRPAEYAPLRPPTPADEPVAEPVVALVAEPEPVVVAAPALPRRRRLARTRRTVRVGANVAVVVGVVWLLVFASDDSLAPRLLPAEPAAAPPTLQGGPSAPATSQPETAAPPISKAKPPAAATEPKSKPVATKPKPAVTKPKPKAATEPERATKPKPKPKPATKPAVKPKPATTPPPAAKAPEQQTFVWAAVPGAKSYRVRFLRDGDVVYAGNTTAPRLVLPATWRRGGRTVSLRPGEYRWQVDALFGDGRPPGVAVVDADYTVPASTDASSTRSP